MWFYFGLVENLAIILITSAISSLLYVIHNRPDIALFVRIVARFFANPKENYMMVLKRIMRYFKGIKDYGLY